MKLNHILEFDKNVKFLLNIKKSWLVVGFSLAKTFYETIAMDLTEWSHEKEYGFYI